MTTTAPSVPIIVPPGGQRTYAAHPSPLGNLLLVAEGGILVALALEEEQWARAIDPTWKHDPESLAAPRHELDEYFAGERRTFSIPVAPSGTRFQLEVWGALTRIAYGTTATYGSIASAVNRPAAARAIGGANHVNPVPIIIPCHRVIGADGSLTGYAGGMARKVILLELEKEGIARE
jgi:methylated-DNA-[protein]-cysteine S-methyltransferase